MHTILIVDDEKNTREGLRLSLEEDFDVYVSANIKGANDVLQNETVDVLVTDLKLGADDGMDLIESALTMPNSPICIMMTAYGSVDTAVEAMKRGAYHFVTKPLNIDQLEILIKRALNTRSLKEENTQLKKQVEKKFTISNILGHSAAMQPVFETIEQVAPSKATVLIDGKNGTGKELVAKAIHNLSGRPKSKLITIHCAALSPQLLESELFGHERGAFTGATEKRIGRFEQADGGTLFLDEIGEIDPSTQVKLLRALGERTIERVGGNKTINIDVRLIVATNRNIPELVAAGEFREDLFYRLNVVRITLPPLKDRIEDIPLLANAFLKEFAKENSKPVKELSSEAMKALNNHVWPGNVRELRTAIEHGVVMSNSAKITLRHLPASIRGESIVNINTISTTSEDTDQPFNLEKSETKLIMAALNHTNGNRTEAAKLLGISRRTLQRKIKEDPINEE
ncbi:MAG: sigma-54-dependent Fis family transcriptional regulator [Akkermansiaceae bacterium]|jgi:two-component system, NtrC family, response regulator AtoC|nr:sigma-54-dependent Fis family transcriptional regulator [Akkermansiaceae bacterium]